MRSHMQVCSLRMSETSQCYLSASGMRRHQSMSGWVFFFVRPRFNHTVYHTIPRLGICRDRRDRRSCKSFVSCVNFSRKQRSFLHILQIFTHLNVNFLHNC